MLVEEEARDKRKQEIFIKKPKSAAGSLVSRQSSRMPGSPVPIEEALFVEDEMSPTYKKEVLPTKIITAFPRNKSHGNLSSTWVLN